MIQVITYTGKERGFVGEGVIQNTIHAPQSLDEFDINVICLSDKSIWENKKGNTVDINCSDDFESIKTMVKTATKSTIIFAFPQNETFQYDWSNYDKKYCQSIELKNMLGNLKQYIFTHVFGKMEFDILYEITKTKIGDKEVKAEFYFNVKDAVLTKSIASEKATTIMRGKVILTTLGIKDYDTLIAFLREIRLIQDKESMPDWMEDVKMFDDVQQIDIIRENQRQIQAAENRIDEARKVIAKNHEYKSILYTNGDELVRVVFEILEKMLGIDLSEFEDKKKEDFAATVGERTFIGEIKGVTSNVKSENISQLDVHYQSYLDEHEDIGKDKISALLIINHQRTKPLSERMVVHERQIGLAKRNGSLIIETCMLLKLFEKYLNRELTRENCIDMLSNNTGLLEIA